MNLDAILSPRHLNACGGKRKRYSARRPPTALDYAAVDDARDLLWLAGALGVDQRLIVLAVCDCARWALPHWERQYPGDARPRRCIEVTEAWCMGAATIAQVWTARDAAYAAPSPSAYASVYASAYAAASASADAAAAAYASAAASAYASATTTTTTSAAAYAAARTRALKDLCVVVRLRLPWPVIWTAAHARGLVESA